MTNEREVFWRRVVVDLLKLSREADDESMDAGGTLDEMHSWEEMSESLRIVAAGIEVILNKGEKSDGGNQQ